MDYRDWHVGMKVVCVRGQIKRAGFEKLKQGKVYTIRSFNVDSFNGAIGIRLNGIINGHHPLSGKEYAYDVRRFRPVQKRKTDISIFTAMLTKAPTPEKESA